jgi:diaminohydroxyphosphoribosylaminopyrimidine deaminase / 5-amino-6-(5-phosphoribosylamino)uracil reductase
MPEVIDAQTALAEACALARTEAFVSGGNPRVGCVVFDAAGTIVGRGAHLGAGFAHAEVVALTEAGAAAAGGTAVVTLEPCRHVGRTPPCTDALIAAGIALVIYAVDDPGDDSGSGAELLRAAGINVVHMPFADADALVTDWMHVRRTGRPYVIAKCAMSVDGRVAAADGSPMALTGAAMNAESHQARAQVDAILIGTETVVTDDPRLTARDANGSEGARQPMRVVVGRRSVPADARIHAGPGAPLHIPEHDPDAVLRQLAELGCQRVLIEGGPTLTAAFIAAQCVDEVQWTLSPLLIGSGPRATGRIPHAATSVAVQQVGLVGEDVRIRGTIGQYTE